MSLQGERCLRQFFFVELSRFIRRPAIVYFSLPFGRLYAGEHLHKKPLKPHLGFIRGTFCITGVILSPNMHVESALLRRRRTDTQRQARVI